MESDKEKKEELGMGEIEIILRDVDQFAEKIGNGEVTFLRKIRAILVDLDLVDIAPKLDEKTLSVLYLVKKLINDFWYNLDTDASFDFPQDSPNIDAFSKNIGSFIQLTLRSGDEKNIKKDKALNYLFKAIKSYYLCLYEIDKKGEEVYINKGDGV